MPYNVAATIILQFFQTMPALKRAVVMVQKEVADRIAAVPVSYTHLVMSIRMRLREERAQATVEMAVVTPVLLVLALIVYNVMIFASAVARFDRVVPDIVLAHAVASEGEGDERDVYKRQAQPSCVAVHHEEAEQVAVGLCCAGAGADGDRNRAADACRDVLWPCDA